MRPIIQIGVSASKAEPEVLWESRNGSNGEKYFDVLDDSGDVTLGYDLALSTYGGLNTITGFTNKPVIVGNCNRYVAPFGTFNLYNPSITSAPTGYRIYTERYDDANITIASWAMIRSMD